MSLTTEQLRALCVRHGINPGDESCDPSSVWAALNELNDMLPVDGIWPIARLSIDDSGQCTGATLYAPGLPPGEHDVYPAAVAQGSGEPLSRERRKAIIESAINARDQDGLLPDMERFAWVIDAVERAHGIGAQKGGA